MKNILNIILIVASIGIFFFYVKPGYAGLNATRLKASSYQSTLSQANLLEQKVNTLQGNIDALDPNNLSKLNELLPNNINNIKFIIDVNTIAADSGLLIKNIQLKPSDPKNNGLYNSVDLSFSVTSSYSAFYGFISSLEKSLRLIDITAISLTTSQANGGLYNFNVTVRTYWLK